MVFTDTRYRAPALHAKQYLLPATVSPHGQRGLSPPSNFVKVISRDCESPRRRRGYGNGTEAQQGVAVSAFTFNKNLTMRRRSFFASIGLLASAITTRNASALPPALAHGHGENPPDPSNAAQTARHYLDRIARLDRRGPELRSIIELNPDALQMAAVLDAERAAGTLRGPLHGMPVVIKDNIATGDRMSTTAGSLALDGVHATRDAYLVGRLRDAGAVILGKTNLSE